MTAGRSTWSWRRSLSKAETLSRHGYIAAGLDSICGAPPGKEMSTSSTGCSARSGKKVSKNVSHKSKMSRSKTSKISKQLTLLDMKSVSNQKRLTGTEFHQKVTVGRFNVVLCLPSKAELAKDILFSKPSFTNSCVEIAKNQLPTIQDRL